MGGTEASNGDTIVLGRNEGVGDDVILESGAEGMSALFLAEAASGTDQPARTLCHEHARGDYAGVHGLPEHGTLVRHKGTMVDFEGKDEL